VEFVQERVTTLHAFGDTTATGALDDVAVVVPVAGRDRGDALRVLASLADRSPARIVVPYRAAPEDTAAIANDLRAIDAPVDPLWCDAPALDRCLTDAGVAPPPEADDAAVPVGRKGHDVWLALGVAAAAADRVAVRDADSRVDGGVDRLVAGLAGDREFAKAYYARVEDRLYGRLCRLLYEPLVAAIEGGNSLVACLNAFRYGLAGEVAMTAELARSIRVEPGFGLEVGMLGEAHRVAGLQALVQVDCGRHRHTHRSVGGEGGLDRMARPVVAALLRCLDDRGIGYDIPRLRDRYREQALALVDAYAADAAFNGLDHDRDGERDQVARYAEAIAAPGPDRRRPPWTETDLSPEAVREAAQPPD
jgi:glucosyl-3-phosphoglycerate synthase